jgi:hypothetical protein
MMKKLLALTAAFGLAVAGANAASGIFGSFVQVNGDWYQTANPGATQIDAFDGADLGTFNLGDTLEITGANVLTFKNGPSDVTGAEIQWRVYLVGDTPGAFTVAGINFGADAPFNDPAGNSYVNGGDQNWGNLPAGGGVQDIMPLAAGDYEVEIFYRATTNVDGDLFSNNGGNNFVATFTVVPEPGTLALLGVGMATLGIVRRRRA